ncbi:MAG: phage terminase large subunit [Gammaproteobacteria bacterium]
MKLTMNEFDALLRIDLFAFIERVYYQVTPAALFYPNWHLELIASKLEACRQGEIRRLILLVPPRSLKSISASVAFPAFWLGHDPTVQLMCVSYGQDLAVKHASDCRTVMLCDWYQRLFTTRLSPDRQAVADFSTTQGGLRMASSVGGVLTGRGANVIVIDDPLKPEQALSESERRRVNQWYENTLYSRLNDKNTGCIIIVMQRLHEDDLVGHVLDQEQWEVVQLSAIADKEEQYVITTPYGAQKYRRKAGSALHPGRESLETLGRIRRTMGEADFSAQYLQQPVPRGGAMVKEVWFPRYDSSQLLPKFDRIIQSWDTANKQSELSDFSVCTTWGITGNHLYMLSAFRKRMNYPELKRAVREQAQLHHASVIVIEDKASGTQLIQELTQEGIAGVKRYQSQEDKVMRLHAQTDLMENGFVHLPKDAPWLTDFLHELFAFPNGRYDDQVDSTAQALDWFKQAGREPGIIGYYRMLAEERKAKVR